MAIHEQQNRLRHVLATALNQSSYYRETLTAVFGPSIKAEELIVAEQWRRIPILSNQIVRREAERMCTRPLNRLDRAMTSGSSGQPLPFFVDRDRSPIEYAFVVHQWARAGCCPDTWRASFRGWHIPNVDTQPFEIEFGLREVRISVFHLCDDLMERYAQELERRGIAFLQGYPSAIATFAAFLTRRDLPIRHKIRGVMLHSEPIYSDFRRTISRGFPRAKIIPFYGLSEKCAFGTEVEDVPGLYEMDPLYGFTELLDKSGAPITEPGRVGRVVSTGLQFTGMPFIRYDTGDEATLVEPPERRNGYRLRVANIVPRRAHDFFLSRYNHLIPATSLAMADDVLRFVTDYQFEQHTPGEVLIRVVLAEGAPPHTLDSYVKLVTERAAGGLSFIPEVVRSIPLSGRGKRKFVIQQLDIAAAMNAAGFAVDSPHRSFSQTNRYVSQYEWD
ncbi:CoF synthetase [Microvirga sp. VF16]|uniref:CoF synthetase n=1 Tax=Microvirga sp. VF16 TaxID=2807101 RepID=UPI00193E2584|nr:CoF synthetase [Microvirga sp. VF16]QRM28029.1 CoF synthetase [Microvirga sp. VF16]